MLVDDEDVAAQPGQDEAEVELADDLRQQRNFFNTVLTPESFLQCTSS